MRVWTVVFIIMAGFEGFDLGSSDDEAASAPDLGLFFPDDDDEPPAGSSSTSTFAAPTMTPGCGGRAEDCSGSERGKYARTQDTPKRLSHAEYAWRHREQAWGNRIGVPCNSSCPYDQRCCRHFTPAMLINAHERVYGPGVCQREGGGYYCNRSERETHRQWRALVLSWVTLGGEDRAATERFTVEGNGPVCSAFARAAYFGLDDRTKDGFAHSSTFNAYMAAARRGNLSLDVALDVSLPEASAALRALGRPADDQSCFETVRWWVLWMRLEDQAPNEAVILHRRVEMTTIFSLEYVPDMKWWGTAGALSRERWTTLRGTALTELSVEFYGQVSDCDSTDVRLKVEHIELLLGGGGVGVPVQKLALRQRTAHSNFSECTLCHTARTKWANYRAQSERWTLGDSQAMMTGIFSHVHEMRAERVMAMELHQQAAATSFKSFQYDDKCGGSFLHLPAPASRPVGNVAGPPPPTHPPPPPLRPSPSPSARPACGACLVCCFHIPCPPAQVDGSTGGRCMGTISRTSCCGSAWCRLALRRGSISVALRTWPRFCVPLRWILLGARPFAKRTLARTAMPRSRTRSI